MDNTDKRKYERTNSLNILNYLILDEQGEAIGEGMGRTLNVSANGVLLETSNLFDKGQTLSITIAMKGEMVDLRGTVTHIDACSDTTFRSGIEFLEIDERGRKILKRFLDAHTINKGAK